MENIKGKVIMISGANRGIGLAIAEKLLSENCRLSLGVRIPEQLPESLSSVADNQLLNWKYDARVKTSAKEWIEATVKHFGKIDGLINNAGILHTIGFEEDDEDLLDDMWEVNTKAPLRLTRLAFPHLKKSGTGRVIDILSMSAKRVKGDWVGYSMSKYAALGASRTARFSGWEHGIRVTAVCPGFVRTDMTEGVTSFPREKMSSPEDIAEIVCSVLRLSNETSVPEVLMNSSFETM